MQYGVECSSSTNSRSPEAIPRSICFAHVPDKRRSSMCGVETIYAYRMCCINRPGEL